jgi:hypothetical protein
LPLAQIATAMPRRRSNQSEVSATSGAKPAAVPIMPIITPRTSEKVQMLPACGGRDGSRRPGEGADQHRHHDAEAGSASRPMRMPPRPNPIMVTVYGKDASERLTPNSAWMTGNTTARRTCRRR